MPRIKVISVLALALFLLVPGLASWAQDTPEPIREAAIRDLQNRVPNIGRPVSWSHRLINDVDNSALGCNLVGGGQAIQPTNVYVVSLNYDDTTYFYHVLPDASALVPCDARLLSNAPGQAATENQDTCAADSPIVANAAAEVVFSTALRAEAVPDAAILTTLASGQTITILSGPICEGNRVWRQATVGGGGGNTGFVLERDNDLGFFPITPAQSALTNTDINPNYTSQTCPPNFTGYAQPRLSIGMFAFVEEGGVNNIIRQNYGRSSTPTGTEMPPGAGFTVLAGPECTDNPGENIVWWQVAYNGTVGWSAESLNDEYFLRPSNAPVTSGSTTTDTSGGFSLGEVPSLGVDASNTSLGRNNAGNLSRLGQMTFPDSISRFDLTTNGNMAVYVRGSRGTNDVIFYSGANSNNITPTQVRDLRPQGMFYAISRNGQGYVGSTERLNGGGADLGMYEIISGDLVFDIPEPPNAMISTVAINFADDAFAYAYTTNNTQDLGAQVYFRGQNVLRPLGVTARVIDMAWNENGTRLATLDAEGTVDIWAVNGTNLAGEIRFLTNVANPDGITLNNAGDRVAVGLNDVVQIWDATTGQELQELTVNFDTTVNYAIGAMAFSPNSELLAVGGYIEPTVSNAGNSVLVFDTASGQQLATLIGHEVVDGLRFNTQGNLLFSHDELLMYAWGLPQ